LNLKVFSEGINENLRLNKRIAFRFWIKQTEGGEFYEKGDFYAFHPAGCFVEL
jgi:hypothetical protein